MKSKSKPFLGIIPARGGSKGVLRKNVRSMAGKPLIAYTIQAAQGSRFLTDLVVSSDNQEILNVAQRWGCPVLKRSKALARDKTPMMPVMKHALIEMEKKTGKFYDGIVLLQPTSPLRTAADIDKAITLFSKSKADGVISVYQVADHHPARMYVIQKKQLKPFAKEPKTKLRQDLTPVFHRNGAIYIYRSALIRKSKIYSAKKILPYVMPRERSINIDDEIDLELAKLLLKK